MPNPNINRRAPGVTLASGGIVYDPEVNDWVTRVIANGGSVSTSTKNAANTFINAVNAVSGLRSKILRLNLFAGDQFLAAQVPFIKDVGSTVDEAFVGNDSTPGSSSDWTYVETGSTGGLTALTAGSYLKTGVGMVGPFAADSYTKSSFGVYVKTASTELGASLGAQDLFNTNSAILMLIGWVDGNSYGYNHVTGGSANLIPDSVKKGLYISSRTSSTLITLYRDGSSVVSNSSATIVVPVSDVTINVFSYRTTTVASNAPTTKQLLGHFEGLDLDATQVTGLTNALVAFNTTLNRQP